MNTKLFSWEHFRGGVLKTIPGTAKFMTNFGELLVSQIEDVNGNYQNVTLLGTNIKVMDMLETYEEAYNVHFNDTSILNSSGTHIQRAVAIKKFANN